MIASQETRFSVRSKRVVLHWLLLSLLVASLIGLPALIAFKQQPYPNLDILLLFSVGASSVWVGVLADFVPLASVIELHEDGFRLKRFCQATRWYSYQSIRSHNERPNSLKVESFQELAVYLSDGWFIIRSNEFADYDYLQNFFAQYGQAGPRRKVLTQTERNRFRWSLVGLALVICANIVFACIAHNPADKNPARLVPVTDHVDYVLENRNKSRLTGFTLRLRSRPNFQFYVSRSDYDPNIRLLKQMVLLNQPITLLIRESDYRKKLVKTEPLTFGDKYDNYAVIPVFGVDQSPSLHLISLKTAQEPTHTNPFVRTMLFGFMLLICWAGWLYVDQHTLLRAD